MAKNFREKSQMVRGKTQDNKGVVKKLDQNQQLTFLKFELFLQKSIMEWNNEYVGKKRKDGSDITAEFKKIKLQNNSIVIQMFKEYPLPAEKVVISEEQGEQKILSWVFAPSRIDNRKHATDDESWVINPLPIMSKGVIVAISDDVRLNYAIKKKEMEAFGLDTSDFVIPSVGDVVYTNHFFAKNMRYYIDKCQQLGDSIVSPEEYTLENFEFLFKITPFEIESIVKKGEADKLVDSKYKYEELFEKIDTDNILDYYKLSKDENWEV